MRKLRDMGIKVRCFETATQRVALPDFPRKCAEEKIAGVFFEGGAQLLFVPTVYAVSYAELSEAEKNKISHRGRAWLILAGALRGRA